MRMNNRKKKEKKIEINRNGAGIVDGRWHFVGVDCVVGVVGADTVVVGTAVSVAGYYAVFHCWPNVRERMKQKIK